MIYLYNTLSGEKEPLEKPRRGKLRLFVCGPTVYDASHIGHARTYIFFDVFSRYLKSVGVPLFYLQNITNIDDKIISRAASEKQDPLALAERFTEVYLKDMETLGVRSVTKYAKATEFIPEIIRQVQTLIKKEYAYEIPDDGYYFDIKKFPEYGKLSRRTAVAARQGVSRIDENEHKRNNGDFCLWKYTKEKPPAPRRKIGRAYPYTLANGEPAWYTPLGWGRPGWHIEDTAISEHYFGPQYDIHGGGLDLKFPHHEAEVTQQEAASGKKPFVKIWMHTGMLTIRGEKMSKSLKNFITIAEMLRVYPADAFRMLVLQHHYRSPFDYNETAMAEAQKALLAFRHFAARLDFLLKQKRADKKSPVVHVPLDSFRSAFAGALADDLNTPKALAALFDLANAANKQFFALDKKEAKTIRLFLDSALRDIFGLSLAMPEPDKAILALVSERELSRNNKQFTHADSLRKQVEALGYIIEDTPLGPLVLPTR